MKTLYARLLVLGLVVTNKSIKSAYIWQQMFVAEVKIKERRLVQNKYSLYEGTPAKKRHPAGRGTVTHMTADRV